MRAGLGGTLNPHLRLGGEGFFWQHGLSADKAPIIVTGTVLLVYYPRLRGGPVLEGGVGLSNWALGKGTGDPFESISADTTYNSGTGWGYTLSIGWEVNPGDGGALVPRLTYAYGNQGTLHAPDGATVATGWKSNLLLLTVGYRGWK